MLQNLSGRIAGDRINEFELFGNLLDPKSEIRFVLKNKKVFRLKEDLGTDPKFWYFVD